KKIESRHFAFKGGAELKSYLVRNTPFFISHSAAYYEFPDRRPMQKKNWRGADLVFDLDADHLKRECVDAGAHEKAWVCGKCLSAVKDETMKLIEEFLVPDFGFSHDEISVNFSGNRGYHVHVQSPEVLGMSGWARKEVADYIAGAGLDAESIFSTGAGGRLSGPTTDSPGWRGKIARRFVSLLEAGKMEAAGVEPQVARRLEKNAEKVFGGVRRGNWDTVNLTKPQKARLAQAVVASAGVCIDGIGEAGGEVDAGVTFDVSKLIRLPNSLHGETGLSAKKLASPAALASFDPMTQAVVFGDSPVRVKCGRVPKFSIKGQEFGPYPDGDAELPEFAAVYLLCKRKAVLKAE
ncbi:MAG: DNA primase small subunit domain-containing protein, partial [Candidatus ainarchaeum sp.]|nr:DNA primase small subunit domain-containing protein [Candidatus ainarchaeum sp.]